MKFIVFLILLLSKLDSFAATIYWDGEAGDGQWNTVANWVGNILPSAADDVILDNSVFNTNYTVFLPAGNNSVQVSSLTISPSGALTILLILPSLNTANPGLSVTGTGNALVLNNNAVLRNSSGATVGSGISITGSFRINNGAHYIHNTGRGNAVIVNQLSAGAGTETGIFEFDVPVASYVLSLSNRTYGTLVLSSAANNGTITYSGSGASALNIQGDLQIHAGVNFAISMSANLIIKGNFNQSASSTFNLQTSTNNNLVQLKGNLNAEGSITESNSGLPVFELNGSSIQDINAANASFTNNVDFRLNNASGANLISGLSLPYRFSINSGNLGLGNFSLSTSAINQVNPPSQITNHIVTNGTGSLQLLAVNSSALFPIGPTTSSYNPVTISSGNGASYSVRVEQGINPPVAVPTYAINRTWFIQSSLVTSGVGLKFQYASADANAGATQPQQMEFLLYSGNAWSVINGNTNLSPAGADPSWTISSSSGVTINNSSTPYALGVNGGWSLPIDCMVDLHGRRNSGTVNLDWTLQNCDRAERIDIERSIDGISFNRESSLIVNSSGRYDYSDLAAIEETLYYRLCIVGVNGLVKYSNVLRIPKFNPKRLIVSIYPNPVGEQLRLSIQSPSANMVKLVIVDLQGRVIKNWLVSVKNGINNYMFSLENLSSGVYFLLANSDDEKVVKNFIKF